MKTIFGFALAISIFLILLFLPFWTAIAVRLIFRRFNKKFLAVLTTIPFTIILMTRRELMPDLEWEEFHYGFKILVFIIALIAALLVNFGIPYLMAKSGISVGDKIMKRNPNQKLEPTVKTPVE